MKILKNVISLAALSSVALIAVGASVSANSMATDFESPAYTLGNINLQNGWSKTGAYDAEVATNDTGYASFGLQSLRISNAVTSGAFGDQTFSPLLSEQAGEAGALDKAGNSVAAPKPHFEAQFDIASRTKAEQTGLAISVSPDGGAGTRMSYLRFADMSDGVHVYFSDVVDNDFTDTDVATLSYTAPHKIKFSIDFYAGPHNDVVKIYVDDSLVKTGTSWEDYYRYAVESNPTLSDVSRTVASVEFRTGGSAVAANLGNGYLIDNFTQSSGAIPLSLPVSKDQCKKDAWSTFGTTFKNQGDCVSFVVSHGKNQ